MVGGLPLVSTGVGTRRTSGRDLWSRAGGFSRILSTPSSVERRSVSGRENLYTAYIPWAVAFGCAEEWAKKTPPQMGAEPAAPVWFVGTGWSGSGAGMASALDSFDSSLQSSISAYQATQRSSFPLRWRGAAVVVAVAVAAVPGNTQRIGQHHVVLDRAPRRRRPRGVRRRAPSTTLRTTDIGAQEALGGIDVQLTR